MTREHPTPPPALAAGPVAGAPTASHLTEHRYSYHSHTDPIRIGAGYLWVLTSWPCRCCERQAVKFVTDTRTDEHGDWTETAHAGRWTPIQLDDRAKASPGGLDPARHGVRVCAWCDTADPRPVTVATLWAHPDPEDCWAGPAHHEHVSWACAWHEGRDRADLIDLGSIVTGRVRIGREAER